MWRSRRRGSRLPLSLHAASRGTPVLPALQPLRPTATIVGRVESLQNRQRNLLGEHMSGDHPDLSVADADYSHFDANVGPKAFALSGPRLRSVHVVLARILIASVAGD